MKGVLLAALVGGVVAAQGPGTPATFEAASIKRNLSDDGFADGGFSSGGRITAVNVTLVNLMTAAYATAPDRIEGGPAWVRQDRFDVVATANRNASVAETRQMLRSLLAERFSLITKNETRERPVFTLTSTRRDRQPGPGLRATTPECAASRTSAESAAPEGGPPSPSDPPCGRVAFGGGILSGRAVGIGQIAASLSGLVGRSVTDRSGLDGLYDFELRFSRQGSNPGPADPPEIFTALREQLAFRLEAARGQVDVLLVVSAAQPSVD